MSQGELSFIPGGRQKVTTSFKMPQGLMERVEEVAEREGVSKSEIYLRAIAKFVEEATPTHSWTTVEPDDVYDPKEFYVFSKDKQGHFAHSRVRIHPHLAGQIQAIVESGAIPEYRTVANFWQDAGFHRAKYLTKLLNNNELHNSVNMVMLLAKEDRIQAEMETAVELLGRLRENCEALLRDGQYPKLRRYLAERATYTDHLPEPVASQYREVLLKYRGELIKRSKT